MTELPPSEKARGRRNYSFFQAFNTFSFTLLSGDFIILYLLKLGAGGSLVGIASSFKYLSFLLMFLGRSLLRRTGTRKLMGTCWLIRYLIMSLSLLSPLLYMNGRIQEGILLTLLALLVSQVMRGIGIVGFKPVMGVITDPGNRGEFLSKLEIITYILSITIGLGSAFFLGQEAPLGRYTVFLGLGIVMGVIASITIFRFPDPPHEAALAATGVFKGMGRALKRPGFAYFMAVLFITSFSLGVSTPFLVLYAKREYLQGDAVVLFLTVAGNIGAVMMGLITRKVIDRLGAKPMFLLFNGLFALSIIPMIVSPSIPFPWLLIFLSALFFFFQMGFAGSQNASQNYFFAVTDPSEHLNLGIFFNVISGLGSAAGALAGGFILDRISSFRLYWSLALVFALLSMLLAGRLKRVGKYSVMDTLSILFSPRDMKAVSLLKQLDHSSTTRDEVKAIKALAETPSEVAVDDLLMRLKNPRYYVRSQALQSLENLPFNREIEEALISEIKNHEFTTAYIAARGLGKKGSGRVKKILRKALESKDYLLQANAALALGRLEDRTSIPMLESLVAQSSNPLVVILSASALEMMRSAESLPSLLAAFRREDPPPFLRDELVLAAAGILGLGEWFYPFYKNFLDKSATGFVNLEDWYSTSVAKRGDIPVETDRLIRQTLTMNRPQFVEAMNALLERFYHLERIERTVFLSLQEALKDPVLLKFDRLVFFFAAYGVKKAVDGA
ncbi:MAG: HEAT repeat domain-containing protein [Spirochaetales bacterium]|nr:HEAT repeat domain-containing protein [Spirochaetales bacterium]